jgi:hypothetical protein
MKNLRYWKYVLVAPYRGLIEHRIYVLALPHQLQEGLTDERHRPLREGLSDPVPHPYEALPALSYNFLLYFFRK